MEALTMVHAGEAAGDCPADVLGWPRESWREWAEHCFTHDQITAAEAGGDQACTRTG